MVKLAAVKLFVNYCFRLNIAISALAKKMNSTNTPFFYLSYYPSYRQKFRVIITRGKFLSKMFFCFCMTVSALENNDGCRKQDFSMPPVFRALDKSSLSLALKVDLYGRYFSSPMPSQGELIESGYLSGRRCIRLCVHRFTLSNMTISKTMPNAIKFYLKHH